jgi:hypothetical protein
MRSFRVSPSMAVASLALLVALGGTSFAAVSAYPRHSVTNGALATAAVDSRVVKNRSLKAADFGVGQIPRGPAGAPGQPGQQGPAGAAGPAGPSDAYVKNVTTTVNIATAGSGVGSVTIPQAGNYVIIAKVGVSSSAGISGDVRCTLTAGGNTDTGTVTLAADGRGVITAALGQQYTAAGSAGVTCNQTVGEGLVNAGQVRIVAIKTGTLTNS